MTALSIDTIREIARHHNYQEVQFNETSRVIAFRNNHGTVRVNVYYTTGTVATCIDHPRSGKTQLFRRNRTEEDLENIFGDPRTHTGVGYYRRHGSEAWQPSDLNSPGSRGSERDDAKRWRYVQAATGFCNESQANQIASFCKLWDNLRFMPGGITSKGRFDTFDIDSQMKILSINGGGRIFCNDGDGCRCKCTERAGSFCNLAKVLATVAFETEGVVGYLKGSDEEANQECDIRSCVELAGCQCQDGIDFSNRYSRMLEKLERQLRSFTRPVRRELLVWFTEKHLQGYRPFGVADVPNGSREPRFLDSEYCSDDVRACHLDYGATVYQEDAKGCHCHGI